MKKNSTRIVVQVQPNSRKNEIIKFEDGVLKLKISAPPVKGKANKELIVFLSDLLEVGKRNITIEKGLTSKRKGLVIEGLTLDEITSRIYRLNNRRL